MILRGWISWFPVMIVLIIGVRHYEDLMAGMELGLQIIAADIFHRINHNPCIRWCWCILKTIALPNQYENSKTRLVDNSITRFAFFPHDLRHPHDSATKTVGLPGGGCTAPGDHHSERGLTGRLHEMNVGLTTLRKIGVPTWTRKKGSV